MGIRLRFHRHVVSSLCLTAAIAVAGCERPPTPSLDYSLQHRVFAQERVFSLIVPVAGSGQAFAARHAQNIKRFARDYLRRGRGPFLVSQSDGSMSSRASRTVIADALVEAGVPVQSVFFQVRSGRKIELGTAELSYSGYAVRVPRCGDWSGEAGFNPSNRSHTDFGCSYQRNTGLMLSNPGDLSVPGESVRHDARTSDRVIQTYRDGKQMGTAAPTLEQKEFSDVK